MKDKDTSTHIM